MLWYGHNPESKWSKDGVAFLFIFCSLLLVSFWAGRLKRSDDFSVMLVVSVKAQFWKKTDESAKVRTPWPGTAIFVSLSPRLPWVTSCCPVSRGMNWRENCKLGLKFKESWEQARYNKLWAVPCWPWAKAPVSWVCVEWSGVRASLPPLYPCSPKQNGCSQSWFKTYIYLVLLKQ